MTSPNLPHSDDLEQAVIGTCLLYPDQLPIARDLVDDADFVSGRARALWQAVCEVADAGLALDPVLVGERLRAKGQYELVGGVYIAEAFDRYRGGDLVAGRAGELRKLTLRRRLIRVCHQVAGLAEDLSTDAADVAVEAMRLVGEVGAQAARGGLRPFDALLEERIEELEAFSRRALEAEAAGGPGVVLGIPTGIHELDRMTGGLQRGDFVVVAARPSIGKTSLGLGFAMSAVEAGYAAGVFSAEMRDKAIVNRALSQRWLIDSTAFLTGRFVRADWQQLVAAREWAAANGRRLRIDDTSGPRPAEMRAKARAMKLELGALDLVLVDYLQLCEPDRQTDNETTAVTKISRALKAIAKELDCVVVALSQLSRLNEKENRAPRLSDLRQSGAIEQDADAVAFLHRPDGNDREFVELHLAKQRNGPTGVINLRFDGPYTRFSGWGGDLPDQDGDDDEEGGNGYW